MELRHCRLRVLYGPATEKSKVLHQMKRNRKTIFAASSPGKSESLYGSFFLFHSFISICFLRWCFVFYPYFLTSDSQSKWNKKARGFIIAPFGKSWKQNRTVQHTAALRPKCVKKVCWKLTLKVFEQERKKDASDLGISSEQHVAILKTGRFKKL